jgi:hypothetical protein
MSLRDSKELLSRINRVLVGLDVGAYDAVFETQ